MGEIKKIYDNNPAYNFLLHFVNFSYKLAYRKIKYIGKENWPKKGAVILAPNHCDALMDPLAVLSINSEPKVFVARADIFGKSRIANILTWLKMIPINRIRDGLRSVAKNDITIKKSVDVLNNETKICISSEGSHRPKHSLLSIGKGIGRMAYAANEKMGHEKPVYILPIGLEYGDYFRYHTTLLVQIGEPINVTEYILQNSQKNEHEIIEYIRKKLALSIAEKIVYIKDDEYYDATWELAKLESGKNNNCNIEKRYKVNKEVISRIETFCKEHQDMAKELFEKVNNFIIERKKAKVSIYSIVRKKPFISALWHTLFAILGFPLFITGIIAFFPLFGASAYAVKKIPDKAFSNSFRYVLSLLLWGLIYIVWSIVLFCNLHWYYALGFILLLIPLHLFVYDYMELLRIGASDWRWLFNKKLKAQLVEIEEIFKKV